MKTLRDEIDAMVEANEVMLALVDVPIGQGLAPDYPLREEYIQILKLAGSRASKERVDQLENLVLAFLNKVKHLA